jgi:hypothetical protein
MESKDKTIKVHALYDGLEPLSDLRRNKTTDKYTAHKIICTTENLRSEIKKTDEVKEKLLNQYAKTDEKGNRVEKQLPDGQTSVTLADPETFGKEWNEFLLSEISFTVFPITFEELPDCFSADDMEALVNLGVLVLPDMKK